MVGDGLKVGYFYVIYQKLIDPFSYLAGQGRCQKYQTLNCMSDPIPSAQLSNAETTQENKRSSKLESVQSENP